jgi:hypothetical protein
MKIKSRRELERWNFNWLRNDPGPWELSRRGIIQALGKNTTSIGVYFMGYSKDGSHTNFILKYCGKAVEQSLYDRLMQHVKASHNRHIAEHLASPGKHPKIWFRYIELPTKELAEELEGLVITAFLWDHVDGRRAFAGWNKRNEWTQHWASLVEQ